MNKKLTKCDFCRYFVGKQCSAEKPDGTVNYYYCRDAQNEFYAAIANKKNIEKKRIKK